MREKVLDFLIAGAIVLMVFTGVMSYYHYVVMNDMVDSMEKTYQQGGDQPQSKILDPKHNYRCQEIVKILSERGYDVSVNGLMFKPETQEADSICKVTHKTLRYWKPQAQAPL